MTDTSSGARPSAVLFDVGNVIVDWDPRRLYRKLFATEGEVDAFLRDVTTMAWHTEHDRGRPFAEGERLLIAEHPQHAEAIRAWRGRWDEMFAGAIVETEAVMRDLHARGVPLYGLTNMSPEVWPGVQAMSDVFALFDDVVVSGDEGLIKPDAAIFHLACQRTGLPPEALVFVDDNAANIAAAQALGFPVVHFTDPAALRPALERF
ncbi:MAG: HAD family phosphatase, partial [Caulobacteraceae bacterium]|nr:HAD family phosphatase [Caulobacter sp.]